MDQTEQATASTPAGIRLIGTRRMQCKDIPNAVFLDAIRAASRHTGMSWKTHDALEERVGPVPWNLFLRKARKLIHAGLIDGCACGCRGDFTIPAEEHDWQGSNCATCGLSLLDWSHVRCPGPPHEPTSVALARLLKQLS